MAAPAVSVDEFVRIYNELGSPQAVAEALKIDVRNVYDRRKRLEVAGHVFATHSPRNPSAGLGAYKRAYPRVISDSIDGIVLVGSDAHYWPEQEPSTAHKAFVWFCKQLKPAAVVLNGDIFDFAAISRHHRIGWSTRPTPMAEIECVVEKVREVEDAAKGAKLYRTPGNHCLRFDGFLSNRVPEMEGIAGGSIKYYLPRWEAAWAIHLNAQLWITHRLRSGVHAPHNNTMRMGQSVCTGHLHSQKVMPVTDLNGQRWGVDCGTLAEADWPQFEYIEGSLPDWRSGFAVFTFRNGKLLPPELVTVTRPGYVCFRGEEASV